MSGAVTRVFRALKFLEPTGGPATSQVPFPDANCIRLADATVSDLNEIPADVRLAG